MALEIVEDTVGALTPATGEGEFTIGNTTPDRVHQSMLLFGDGRSEALKRLVVMVQAKTTASATRPNPLVILLHLKKR